MKNIRISIYLETFFYYFIIHFADLRHSRHALFWICPPYRNPYSDKKSLINQTKLHADRITTALENSNSSLKNIIETLHVK